MTLGLLGIPVGSVPAFSPDEAISNVEVEAKRIMFASLYALKAEEFQAKKEETEKEKKTREEWKAKVEVLNATNEKKELKRKKEAKEKDETEQQRIQRAITEATLRANA